MNEQADTVEGAVEATAQNSSQRYGVKIGGEWFDGRGQCPVAKGDQVKVVFASNGKSNQILGFQQLAQQVAAQPNGNNDVDRRIARAVALKVAGSVVPNGDPMAILRMAEKLEEWLNAAPSPTRGLMISHCHPLCDTRLARNLASGERWQAAGSRRSTSAPMAASSESLF